MPRLYPSLSILGRNSAGDVGLVAQFFGLLELAVDRGRREAGLFGNLADGLVISPTFPT